MSFWSLVETFFIGPLKLLFEVIFNYAHDLVLSPGLAIIFLSLAMNILILPLYRRADAMQEKARDTEAALKPGITHIKKTFSGNERMMMLQTYYRQNNYSPTNALRGSVSLLLEIPFFMAAYRFLSTLEILKGVSFGPIADLSRPDGLLTIGSLTLNLLPIIMTVINFVSAAIYLRGFPLKTKIQLYGMAVFFLFFLYSSPSGLVFYWTLNNVFSLVKNIFYKIPKPGRIISVISALAGAACIVTFFNAQRFGVPQMRRLIVPTLGFALLIPLLARLIRSVLPKKEKKREPVPHRPVFILSAVFLTVFVGVLIPSAYVASSPQEFIDVSYFFHPLWYVARSGVMAAGTFILWFGVFYWLASPKGKVVFERIMAAFAVVAAVNYMFFGTKLGVISSSLVYESGLRFEISEILINAGVLIAVAALVVLAVAKWKKAAGAVLLAGSFAVAVMAGVNIVTAKNSIDGLVTEEGAEMPHFTLSRTGKNVVVIMLDRALGDFFPYLVAENPELEKKFDGFTYYSNVISFGGHTNMAVPAMLGGYEYTPVELNKRDSELLVDKHNEALKVMPVLFMNEGYDVTVCDAPYANYGWIPDLSIYDEYPEISKYITLGYFGEKEKKQQAIDADLRNFFCFSLMKSLPLAAEYAVYDRGDYHSMTLSTESAEQEAYSMSVAKGENQAFIEPYNVLCSLDRMTKVTKDDRGTFLFLSNDTPHEPMLLKEPEYVPAPEIDNTVFDSTHQSRFTLNGRTLHITTVKQMAHYQTNMAALNAVGEWLDYLRAEGVYDNTRIIIAGDHGYYLFTTDALNLSAEGVRTTDAANFFPLLLVKDFNETGFKTSDEFMTNADIPTIALEGLVEDPRNPFTGNPINSDEKTAHDQFIMTYHTGWDTAKNNGTQFLPTPWVAVTDNIWNRGDWEYIDVPTVLTEHKIP